MKHTHHIKMRAVFWATLGVACFAFAPSVAFGGWVGDTMCACPGMAKPLDNNANCEDACYGTRSAPSGGNSTPSYDYGAAQRAQEAEAERQRQHAEAERQRQAETDRIERERKAEEERQRKAAFIRDRDSAANSLKGSTGSAMGQLKGLAGADDSGLKGSGFDTGGSGLKGLQGSVSVDNRNESAGLGGNSKSKGKRATPKPAPHTDTSVVDARVPRDGAYLTDQVPELKNSPAADRITKGFQAVINHDWPVALAWWQDALIRDPNNAALKRSVDLAQWMVDRPKAKAAKPVTPLGAAIYSASHGNSAEAIHQFELVKKENPAIAPQVDDMINELRQRQKKEAPAHKNSIEIEKQIAEWDRQWVEKLYEDGMNMLSIGEEKQAQWIFHFADSVSQKKYAQPLPAPKAGKTK